MSTFIYESFLRSQGFKYERQNFGISFQYQGRNFLIFDDSNDELYLQVLMPGIYKLNSLTEEYKVLKALNNINNEIKAIKGCLHDDVVWLHIEMFMDKTPNVEDYFIRLLDILIRGQMSFAEQMSRML